MVLAAILSIDTKQQDDDRGRQDAAEGAQTEGGKLQRKEPRPRGGKLQQKERRAKAQCARAPSRMSMCMREICSLLPLEVLASAMVWADWRTTVAAESMRWEERSEKIRQVSG